MMYRKFVVLAMLFLPLSSFSGGLDDVDGSPSAKRQMLTKTGSAAAALPAEDDVVAMDTGADARALADASAGVSGTALHLNYNLIFYQACLWRP